MSIAVPNGETQIKKHVHVFASDILPYPNCPRSAGSNRSWQIISALRGAGHEVTYSMPLSAHLSRLYAQDIINAFTPEERWSSEHFFEPEVVLNRIAPDIAVYCNVNCFRSVRRFAREIVHILDMYGPLQFEGLLLDSSDYKLAMHDGALLEQRCRELVEKLRFIDHLVTVSERQKYFWAAYCSMAGFAFSDLKILVCPVSFEVPRVARRTASTLTMVYSGGFYPWQNPENALRAAADILDEIPGAKLHIFGGPHAGLPNVDAVNKMLSELQEHQCVEYHGYRPTEEVAGALATAWCALELMDQNLERELAITGRTVEFLSTGTPVIYNNYSTLSKLIETYDAGWTLSPGDHSALRRVIMEISTGGLELIERRSGNALNLAASEFGPAKAMTPLVEVCERPLTKRPQSLCAFGTSVVTDKRSRLGTVLAISPDSGAIGELRVSNPLRALERQGLIQRFKRCDPSLDALRRDDTPYEAILVQRAVPEFIYLTLRSLGLPFVLDVDDNLLARACYRTESIESELAVGLRYATVLTVPTPRLAYLLEQYSSLSLVDKAYVTPNALPFSGELRDPSQPERLIWIQSDIAALVRSQSCVIDAVESFSKRHQLPVVLIGRNVLSRPQFTHQVEMGQIDLDANLELLASGPAGIGLAPLETEADQETLDFVAGKSDLKMLLFGGHGHPGVYSAAPPYTDSTLQSYGCIVNNTKAEWLEALEFLFREGWRSTDAVARDVRALRDIDRVARESWLPALERCILRKPVTGAELHDAFVDTDSYNSAMSIGAEASGGLEYLAEATSSDMVKLHRDNLRLNQRNIALQKELVAIRNSYSWRITKPLRRLAKPLMERRQIASTRRS